MAEADPPPGPPSGGGQAPTEPKPKKDHPVKPEAPTPKDPKE